MEEDIMPELKNRFTHHPPIGDQIHRYEAIRDGGLLLSQSIAELCPSSRERSIALTQIETAIMWANAAIARNEVPLEG